MSEHAYTARALPRQRDVRRTERPGAISALGVAALCVAGLAIVWTLASQVPIVRVKDAVALYDFTLLSGPRIDRPLNVLLQLLEPAQFALWGVALVAVALARERPRVALAVVALMALAPLTARSSSRCWPIPTSGRRRQHRRRVVAERPFDRRARARAVRGARRAARLRAAGGERSARRSRSPSVARC